MSNKIKMSCPECSSSSILADAWAYWDIQTQEWQLSDVFDEKYCPSCEYKGTHCEEEECTT